MRIAAFTFLAVIVVVSSPASAQKPKADEAQAKRVARLEIHLDALDEALKKKDDKEQGLHLTAIVAGWKDLPSRSRTRFRKQHGKVLKTKTPLLKKAAIESLGKMGGGPKNVDARKSTSTLKKLAASRALKADRVLFLFVLKAVGELGHPSGVDILYDQLSDKDVKIITGAIDTLGAYNEAKINLKKDIFKTVLRTIPGEITGGGQRPGGSRPGGRGVPGNPRFNRERRSAIARAVDRTLVKLTGQKIAGEPRWRRWWNKVGKKARAW